MPPRRTSKRVAELRPTAVNAVLAEVAEFQRQGGRPVSLMRGQPDFPTPPHIVAAARDALASGRTAYPNNQGEPALRDAVARRLDRQAIGDYSPHDEILMTSGATFGIYAALAAVLDPGDGVLVPEPMYDAYGSVVALLGGVTQTVSASIVDGRFTLDPAAVAAACGPRTRALLLNTPWNPTGTVLARNELTQLMSVATERDLTVISDEIYDAIVYDARRHLSPAAVSDEARHRTIIVNSFSKTYSMTGWRLGYCAGPAELIQAMFLVLQQSSRGPATFVQDAGLAALDGPQACVVEMVQEYARRRQQVRDALHGLKNVRVLMPEGGFFAMADIGGSHLSSDEVRRRLLTDFGIVVMHGGAYGSSAEGTLRVSFAAGEKNLQTGLERLRAGLAAIVAK